MSDVNQSIILSEQHIQRALHEQKPIARISVYQHGVGGVNVSWHPDKEFTRGVNSDDPRTRKSNELVKG